MKKTKPRPKPKPVTTTAVVVFDGEPALFASSWRDKARQLGATMTVLARSGGDEFASDVERVYREWTRLQKPKAMLLAALAVIEAKGIKFRDERDPKVRADYLARLCESIAEATSEDCFAIVDAATLERETRTFRSYVGPGQRRGDEWLLAKIAVRANARGLRKDYRDTPKGIARLVRLIRKYANEKR